MDINGKHIQGLVKKCKKRDRKGQEELYRLLYPYAMSICLRYTRDEEEAIGVLNAGFMKVFTKLDQYNDSFSFKSWVRRIMVNTAIDHYRSNQPHTNHLEISSANQEQIDPEVVSKVSEREIMALVQKLPPAYRLVFNLYAIEGYNHREIAEQLNISEGTSKSNLAKARAKLQRMIKEHCQEDYHKYGS